MVEFNTVADRKRVGEEAADWCLRIDDPDLSEADWAAFQAWVRADPIHEKEFQTMRRLWGAAEFLKPGIASPRPATHRRLVPFRRMAMAAMVGVLTIGLGWFLGVVPGRVGLYWAEGDAPRKVTLFDGSQVTLNLRTTVIYAVFRNKRWVIMPDGEAFFDIAHDASRPFTVHAGGRAVTALGTRFNVWSDDDGFMVTLEEGSVLVDIGDDDPTILSSGNRFRSMAGGRSSVVEPVDPEMVTAWRGGKLVLDDVPLAIALPLISRYLDDPIKVGDDRVAAMRIGGIYDTNQMDRVATALPKALPVRAVEVGGEVTLFSK
ncbi:MAG: FecR domain-containing protein [Rhodospirillum sp.]|nr:FecR domain-containing protein [Rhodospirillum sp.]MCF8490226.1 FecR domain-containing protein [Rhodospirillum sp.]MCF8500997.1 FecR domain-containing protein [Rhodospirillum sp.]